MMRMLINWLITTVVILISPYFLSGIRVSGVGTALLTALVLGLINAIIKPILVIFTFPLTIITLGLFIFVLNALLVLLTSAIVPGFHVQSFGWALIFSLLFSVVSFILHRIL